MKKIKKPVKKPVAKKVVKKPVRRPTAKPAQTALVVQYQEQVDTLSKELEALKSPKGKLSLIDSPIQQNQLLQILQKTPAEHVRQRPGKGGGTWDYVTGTYVKKVLNYAFGWCWDYEIISHGDTKFGNRITQVWVLGKLTIKDPKTMQPILIKQQFGGADVKYKVISKMVNGKSVKTPTDEMLDYANDLKAAATDALKKCAAELGIASDIYGKNEFKEIGDDVAAFIGRA